MACPAFFFELRQAQFVGDPFEQMQFTLIATELVLFVTLRIGMARRPGVFEERTQGGMGQAGAAIKLMVFQLREHPESLGIAFKAQEVSALDITHIIEPATVCGLLKPVTDSVFTRMPEGRVANVMGQTGRLYNHAQITGVTPVGQGAAKRLPHTHAQ